MFYPEKSYVKSTSAECKKLCIVDTLLIITDSVAIEEWWMCSKSSHIML